MILLPDRLREQLRANAAASLAAEAKEARFDPVPLLKLFNPLSAATWLATELYDDGDTLFGLADLGFGCAELGNFSLSEIGRVHLPFGLRIERDIVFETTFALSVWCDWSRRSGSILWAETLLNRAALGRSASDLPPSGG
jgi:hypothetical protein